MEITYNEPSKADFPEILFMMADFYAFFGYPFDRVAAQKNLRELIENKNIGRLWLIRAGIDTAGYVVLAFGFSFEYKGRDAFIDELYLKEAFRKKGIGKNTMRFVEKQALELGINAVHLEVERDNKAGRRLYNKQGYTGDRILLTKWMV